MEEATGFTHQVLPKAASDIRREILESHQSFTPMQQERKGLLEQLQLESFTTFCLSIYSAFEDIYSDTLSKAEKVNAKELTEFQKLCNTFLSDKASTHVKKLFGKSPSKTEHSCAMVIMTHLRGLLLEQKALPFIAAQETKMDRQVNSATAIDPNSPGASKVRYLAGRCVAKARWSLISAIRWNMYSNRTKYHVLKEHLDAVCHLRVSEHLLVPTTSFSTTLHETSRRQNVRRSLTNVSDPVHLFFCSVESKRQTLETPGAMHLFGGKAISISQQQILKDEALIEQWRKLYDLTAFDQDTLAAVFKDVVSRYMFIANNEYRKTLVQLLRQKKTHAHRVEVQKKSKSNTEQPKPGPSKPLAQMQTPARKGKSKGTGKGSKPPAQMQSPARKGKNKGTGKGKGKGKKRKRDVLNICRVCDDEYIEGAVHVSFLYLLCLGYTCTLTCLANVRFLSFLV